MYAKWVVPGLAVLAAALAAFAAPIQDLIVAHPAFSGVLAALLAIVGAFAPQPQKP